jgi:hypothetical protein
MIMEPVPFSHNTMASSLTLSKVSFGPSKATLRIASKVLLPTQWALNHSQPTPKLDPPNHQKHPQLTINLPTWESNINVPRTSMHLQTSSLNLQSIYCQDMATITIITIVTHNCKTKRKDEEKTNILALNSMYPWTRLRSRARSEATR